MTAGRFRLDLTPHQRAALLTVIAETIASPTGVEVSIDATTGDEIPIEELLTLVMNAPLVVPVPDESLPAELFLDALREEAPSLTPADRRELQAIEELRDDAPALIQRVRGYYRDLDRAQRTPRGFLYLHLGLLAGALQRPS